ncbi:Xanthine phosphoribosyltransferase 1 [Mortierella alpina]|uniref:Xanthine phosphoribosyltransferase 1 n=1 Tax=Mortierella alpina TaxID=64518 RepID=A0A9P6JCV4_MORAP|nr:Xanthine phosphoribosyltransferase 1 [Mortierella alpina]
MAAIIAAAPSRRRYTYRGYRRHPRSILFCIVMITIIVKLGFFIHSHLSIISPPEDLTPAKPVERLDIPMLFKFGEPLSSWKTAWIVHQELDSEVIHELKQACTFDLVYTWVNGSDPDLEAMRQRYKILSPAFATMAMSSGKGAKRRRKGEDPTLNRFRDMDELRYSLRSVAQYAEAGLFKTIRILTTDVEEQQEEDQERPTGERTLHQQTPQWLDLDKAKGMVKLVRHSEMYEDLAVLPSFNSLSIESQMHRIPGLADIFVYLNDDVFFGNPINSASLWTPLYGFVFHLDTLTTVGPAPAGPVEDLSAVGEWHSLTYTNSILSKQFGARHRVYLAHIPHVLSVSLMNEIQALWPQEFTKTSQHRFRGEGQAREIQVSFLLAHYVMERLRETQLKSYWTYRLDRNQDGRLDWEERHHLLEMVETYHSAMVKRRREADPRSVENVTTGFLKGYDDRLYRAGISINATTYALSGQDEYPFMLASGNLKKPSRVQNKRPYYVKRGERQCVFEVEFCLGAAFRNQTVAWVDASTGAGSIFERMAFTEFHCSDCLLHILRHAGEAAGTSAIMPLDRASKAFGEVAADLYKYNYVVGQTDFAFLQLKNARQAEGALNGLMRRKEAVSFFCINDDVPDNALTVKKVRSVFSEFLKRRFPVSSPWEKPGSAEEIAW